ncbi:MAG: MBL fold metallo-hydrolase [Anaerolineales bacterium]|jgi:hydroxyacylglutathione hydrolase
MIEIRKLPVGEYQTNCYLLIDSAHNEAVLIDPGDQADEILRWVGSIKVLCILITHGHRDHIAALEEVRRTLNAPVYIHPADSESLDREAEFAIHDGAQIDLGGDRIEFVHIPGHTPGSVGFTIIESGVLKRAVVGDAIFPGGPGHTESPEALAASIESLSESVFSWPDSVILYPGHGDPTTVGLERGAFEAFRSKPVPPDLCGDVTWL